MKIKRKHRKVFYFSLIPLLLVSLVFSPISQVFANNKGSAVENSGGFIIESAKVDGSMDLVGALTGNITIWEGEIHGLTIVKVLERGEGHEPLVVKITAPGPIPVKNLNAQTVNNELPNIGGLCEPGQLGWVCMENVVMNVEEQFVENISLANASIHTCYLSECGSLPEYNPLLSIEELEELLHGKDDEGKLEEIIELIEEQEVNLERLKKLLAGTADILNELVNQDYVGKLEELLVEIEDSITSKLGLDKILPDYNNLTAALDYVETKLATSIDSLADSEIVIKEMEASIPKIEEKLTDYENQNKEQIKLEKQFGVFSQIIQLAERQKEGEEIAYELAVLKESNENEESINGLKSSLNVLKERLDDQKEIFEKLSSDAEELEVEEQNLIEEANRLKTLLEQLGLNEDTEDGMLDTVQDEILDPVLDPVQENVLDPVQEDVLNPILDNVEENILNPVKEKVVAPIKEEVLDPILDPVTGKLIDPVTGQVIVLVLDPVTNELLDPITEEVIEPIVMPLTGRIVHPETGEVVKHVLDPVTGELLDPKTDGLLKKILGILLP
ncbi:hypothetical protein [Ornithinibacillus sp. 179-J 7C1 HS]|uniref:hypothetical protein n=1 Tax=Ornithinibacillus sp. 179-J 7C1 HS TaxID=3142384 RepID=UPI0039A1D936